MLRAYCFLDGAKWCIFHSCVSSKQYVTCKGHKFSSRSPKISVCMNDFFAFVMRFKDMYLKSILNYSKTQHHDALKLKENIHLRQGLSIM